MNGTTKKMFIFWSVFSLAIVTYALFSLFHGSGGAVGNVENVTQQQQGNIERTKEIRGTVEDVRQLNQEASDYNQEASRIIDDSRHAVERIGTAAERNDQILCELIERAEKGNK